MQLSFGANLHLIHKPLEKPLIYWAFSIKKLSELLITLTCGRAGNLPALHVTRALGFSFSG